MNRDDRETVPSVLMTTDVRVNVKSSYIQLFAADKLLEVAMMPKTFAIPVNSLATGFDLESYRRRRIAAVHFWGLAHYKHSNCPSLSYIHSENSR